MRPINTQTNSKDCTCHPSLSIHTPIFNSIVYFPLPLCEIKMANTQFLTYFFIFMILSHQLVLIEGRRLKVKKNGLRCGTCMTPDTAKTITKPSDAQKSINNNAKNSMNKLHHRIADGFVDAFRPTTPGHSPGVGHSIQNR